MRMCGTVINCSRRKRGCEGVGRGSIRGRLHRCGINYSSSGGNVVFAIYSTFCQFRELPEVLCALYEREGKGGNAGNFPTHGRIPGSPRRGLDRFLTL